MNVHENYEGLTLYSPRLWGSKCGPEGEEAVAEEPDEVAGVEEAVEKAHKHLHAVLDGRAVQHKEKVEQARADVLTMSGEEARGRIGGGFSYKSF